MAKDNYSLTEQAENAIRATAEACVENARLQADQELLRDNMILRAENDKLRQELAKYQQAEFRKAG